MVRHMQGPLKIHDMKKTRAVKKIIRILVLCLCLESHFLYGTNIFHMKMSSNKNSQANKVLLIVHIFNKNLTLPKILDLRNMTTIG